MDVGQGGSPDDPKGQRWNITGLRSVRDWIRLGMTWPVVRRALKYAVVVGAILIMINHGDAVIRGDLDGIRILKMSLTVLVPYAVSALSSVGAMREIEDQAQSRGGEERHRE